MSDREILVYVDHGAERGVAKAGRLFMRARRGRESATFDYDPAWLQDPMAYPLDPVFLPLARGAFHTPEDRRLFPGLADSAPDRWGRRLIGRRARLDGLGRTLLESDYLLMVSDETRQGALRFKETEDGPFLAAGEPPIPPLVMLGELLAASDRLLENEDDIEALRLLIAPGSSLGGARPKASVLSADGALSIAKFPSQTDEWPVVVWEKIACTLAGMAGLRVQEAELVDVGGRGVLLTRRFDRVAGLRIPFLSGMAMLGASDGDERYSYLHLCEAIRRHGARIDADLKELWRRMVFAVLISSTDDHLRNHAFLREAGGWVLSPAYDINPIPTDVKPRVHALALDETNPEASFDTLMSVAGYFGLEQRDARAVAAEVATATGRWRDVARDHGLRASRVERMASAFEHEDYREALACRTHASLTVK